jgi:hypothetical protein
MINESLFTIGQLEKDGMISLCWYRQSVSVDTRQRLPNQFIVEWEFSDVQPNGLPPNEEYESALELQNMMTNALEADNEAVLAVISTGNGYREWYFYCRNQQLLKCRFNAVVNGREFPVELHAGSDPDWKVYEEFIAPFTDDH